MNKLTPDEWQKRSALLVDQLSMDIEMLQLHPDEAERAARWCLENGVRRHQFLNLLFVVGFRILAGLGHDEREIIEGMGDGFHTVEGASDDLPF